MRIIHICFWSEPVPPLGELYSDQNVFDTYVTTICLITTNANLLVLKDVDGIDQLQNHSKPQQSTGDVQRSRVYCILTHKVSFHK